MPLRVLFICLGFSLCFDLICMFFYLYVCLFVFVFAFVFVFVLYLVYLFICSPSPPPPRYISLNWTSGIFKLFYRSHEFVSIPSTVCVFMKGKECFERQTFISTTIIFSMYTIIIVCYIKDKGKIFFFVKYYG